jgi:hypothetical protein
MLLGFPLDFWNHDSIQNAIGKVLLWENYRDYLARLLVKSRVTYLYGISHFIVIIETEGF